MPRIKEYSPSIKAAQPQTLRRATAADFGDYSGFEAAGAGLQDFGSSVQKANGRAEVSDLYAKMSEAHSQFTIDLQDQLKTADPNDKEFAQNFTQKYDDYMSKISSNVSTEAGREYFARTSAAYKAHFYETAAVGQSHLAGEKAVTDYQSSLNSLSSALVSDPSSFQALKQQHDDFLDSGAVPAEAAIKLKLTGGEHLAKSAIQGWINLNPEYAKEQISQGAWDKEISGDVKVQMLAHADQGIRAQEVEQERAKRKQQEAIALAQQKTQNDFLQKMVDGSLSSKEILASNLDPFGSGSKEQFIKLQEAGNQGFGKKSDPSTVKNLFDRIHLPDGDPNKLIDENQLNTYVSAGNLSFADLNLMRGEMLNKKTEQGAIESQMKKRVFDMAEAKLVKKDPMTGLGDPLGQTLMLQFMRQSYLDEQSAKKAGVSAVDMYDPKNPNFIGRSLPNFQRTQQDVIKSIVGANKSPDSVVPPPPPADPERMRKPGESIGAWRERTRAK